MDEMLYDLDSTIGLCGQKFLVSQGISLPGNPDDYRLLVRSYGQRMELEYVRVDGLNVINLGEKDSFYNTLKYLIRGF